MKIYYTGSVEYNTQQLDKDLSIGGYKSSSLVPNDIVGNLFGSVSMYSLDKNLRETRAIIIHNDSATDKLNLYLWFEKLLQSVGRYEVAAVALTPDSDGEVSMESIGSIRATPYSGVFVEADGKANKQLILPNFEAGSYIGIWLRRVLTDSDKDIYNPDVMYQNFIANPRIKPQTEGSVSVVFEWD